MKVDIREAGRNMSRLVDQAARGEEVIIVRAGEPVAQLVPYEEEHPPRRFGVLEGQIRLAQDWDSDKTNEAIAEDFYAEGDD